jgi:hypothetical protein
MDVSSIAASLVAMQAGNLQQQIATSVLKQNIDQQRSVLQLLQLTPNAANLAPGVGGNLDITA